LQRLARGIAGGEGGLGVFAAVYTDGCYAQIVIFAKFCGCPLQTFTGQSGSAGGVPESDIRPQHSIFVASLSVSGQSNVKSSEL